MDSAKCTTLDDADDVDDLEPLTFEDVCETTILAGGAASDDTFLEGGAQPSNHHLVNELTSPPAGQFFKVIARASGRKLRLYNRQDGNRQLNSGFNWLDDAPMPRSEARAVLSKALDAVSELDKPKKDSIVDKFNDLWAQNNVNGMDGGVPVWPKRSGWDRGTNAWLNGAGTYQFQIKLTRATNVVNTVDNTRHYMSLSDMRRFINIVKKKVFPLLYKGVWNLRPRNKQRDDRGRYYGNLVFSEGIEQMLLDGDVLRADETEIFSVDNAFTRDTIMKDHNARDSDNSVTMTFVDEADAHKTFFERDPNDDDEPDDDRELDDVVDLRALDDAAVADDAADADDDDNGFDLRALDDVAVSDDAAVVDGDDGFDLNDLDAAEDDAAVADDDVDVSDAEDGAAFADDAAAADDDDDSSVHMPKSEDGVADGPEAADAVVQPQHQDEMVLVQIKTKKLKRNKKEQFPQQKALVEKLIEESFCNRKPKSLEKDGTKFGQGEIDEYMNERGDMLYYVVEPKKGVQDAIGIAIVEKGNLAPFPDIKYIGENSREFDYKGKGEKYFEDWNKVRVWVNDKEEMQDVLKKSWELLFVCTKQEDGKRFVVKNALGEPMGVMKALMKKLKEDARKNDATFIIAELGGSKAYTDYLKKHVYPKYGFVGMRMQWRNGKRWTNYSKWGNQLWMAAPTDDDASKSMAGGYAPTLHAFAVPLKRWQGGGDVNSACRKRLQQALRCETGDLNIVGGRVLVLSVDGRRPKALALIDADGNTLRSRCFDNRSEFAISADQPPMKSKDALEYFVDRL